MVLSAKIHFLALPTYAFFKHKHKSRYVDRCIFIHRGDPGEERTLQRCEPCGCREIAQKGKLRSKPILPTGMKACQTSFCTQKESSKGQDLGVEAEFQGARTYLVRAVLTSRWWKKKISQQPKHTHSDHVLPFLRAGVEFV